jgi:hypothetical protein
VSQELTEQFSGELQAASDELTAASKALEGKKTGAAGESGEGAQELKG